MRWLTNFYNFRFEWTATTGTGIHPTKTWLSQMMNFKNAIWTWGHFRRMICNKSCMNWASVFEWHKRFKEGKKSVRDDERCRRSKEIRTPELIGQRVRVRVIMLRFWGSSGRDSVGRGQHSSNQVRGISTRAMHQSTTPSLSQTIWLRWASRQFLTLLIVQTLLPVTFDYSISSEFVEYVTLHFVVVCLVNSSPQFMLVYNWKVTM